MVAEVSSLNQSTDLSHQIASWKWGPRRGTWCSLAPLLFSLSLWSHCSEVLWPSELSVGKAKYCSTLLLPFPVPGLGWSNNHLDNFPTEVRNTSLLSDPVALWPGETHPSGQISVVELKKGTSPCQLCKPGGELYLLLPGIGCSFPPSFSCLTLDATFPLNCLPLPWRTGSAKVFSSTEVSWPPSPLLLLRD